MADKKKMSVAEMLAAARKADGGGESSSPEAAKPAKAPAESSAAGESPAKSAAPPKPVPKLGAAGRPSVAEMMAMARAGQGASPAAAEKPAAEKAAPAPKPKPAAAAKTAAAASPAAPTRDTASILTAARQTEKPGPMSKAEAAAKAGGVAAVAKPKITAPPMPMKPAYAMPKPVAVPAPRGAGVDDRRDFFSTALAVGFWALGAVSALWTLLTVKFMFPNVLREPPSKFKVGFPDAFPFGQVQEKFKAQFGVWVVNAEFNGEPQIFALKSVCTHLGCTPNWLEAEQKFKCPCHGSGFYRDGVNFEGPAPRPLERYSIRLADDGQIEVDKSRTFQEEMGQWSDPQSFVQV